MAILIKNARAVVGSDVVSSDVLVDGEIIVRVDDDIPAGSAEIIDAAGKYLLPGGVDAHTHFDLDLGKFRAVDDFLTGSVAAACGGTTTIVDHVAFGPKGCGLGHQIAAYHKLAKPAVVDYSFHGVIQHVDEQVLAEMATLVEEGITSHKIYLTYAGMLHDPDVLKVFERARDLGVVICVHCENDAIIANLSSRFLAAGESEPWFHAKSRPAECEAEAVYRMLAFAAVAGDAPLYIVHLSAAKSLEAARNARRHGQRNIFVETCPQYLLLNEERYRDPSEGLKYIMSPPLRTEADNSLLWEGIRSGEVDVVATDHCPFNFAVEKQAGREGFTCCPGGIPGVEARLSLMFSFGFMAGRIPLPDVVRLCCTTPARIFGLYPKKGAIVPGSDADLVLFDPDAEWVLTHGALHENVDYTPYEGFRMRGKPVMTISRGEVVAQKGKFVGTPGRGRFVKRGRPDLSRV